jgi:hypothetical protein
MRGGLGAEGSGEFVLRRVVEMMLPTEEHNLVRCQRIVDRVGGLFGQIPREVYAVDAGADQLTDLVDSDSAGSVDLLRGLGDTFEFGDGHGDLL